MSRMRRNGQRVQEREQAGFETNGARSCIGKCLLPHFALFRQSHLACSPGRVQRHSVLLSVKKNDAQETLELMGGEPGKAGKWNQENRSR